MDKDIDRVIFRVATYDRFDCEEVGDQELLAFFPDAPANTGNILCYAFIGQHSEASIDFYKYNTKKPTKKWNKEIEDMRAELIGMGYNIKEVTQ